MPIDIASLERATLAAVPPQQVQELPGWLLALDDGTVGRAHSAVPLRHAALPAEVLDTIAARYREHGLAPMFRIPRAAGLQGLHDGLVQRGFVPRKPTLTQVGEVAGLLALATPAPVELATRPDASWAAVFLGEGFDPVDGASRLGLLRRAQDSVFASVRVDGQLVAVGSGCYAEGWCGIHGMRTLPGWRGRGLAAAILAALGRQARERGIARCFLQVQQDNAGAQKLYARAGLATAWCYDYWERA